MTRREKALEFATKAHAGQKRKDGKDYITHPIAVAEIAERIAKENGLVDQDFLDDTYIIALFHDLIEDTDLDYEDIKSEWGTYIAYAVLSLSRKIDETYFDFIMRLIQESGFNIIPRIVKLADLEHNMSDLSEGSLKDKYRFAHYILSRSL